MKNKIIFRREKKILLKKIKNINNFFFKLYLKFKAMKAIYAINTLNF